MATPAHHIQGSPEWHEYRATRGNASETSALIYNAPFYPKTPHQLWLVKTGREQVYENEAMQRGKRLEEAARQAVEERFGIALSPGQREHGRLSASLDGIEVDDECLAEIKVPVKGRESEAWQYVAEHGWPPEHYWWQVQHQLLCAGIEVGLFCVVEFDDHDQFLDLMYCTVPADPSAQQQIIEAWDWFFPFLDNDDEPPQDIVERGDDEWVAAAERFRAAKEQFDAAKRDLDEARNELVELAGDQSTRGAGVKLQYIYKKGSVDYKQAVPEGIDLEQYRKPGSWSTRVDLEGK